MGNAANVERWEIAETRETVVTLPSGARYYVVKAPVRFDEPGSPDEDLMMLWTARRREGDEIEAYGSAVGKGEAIALARHRAALETGKERARSS